MKVKELIEELQRLDGELEVYVSKDPEGNSFQRCAGVWDYFTDEAEGEYRIESIYSDEDLKEENLIADDFVRRVAIIWP